MVIRVRGCRMTKIQECLYGMQTHLSTTAVSPFLYSFTMSWWVGGSLRTCSFLFFGLGAAAFRVDRARRGNVRLEDQAKACSPTDQPVRKIEDSSGINMTMKIFYIPDRVILGTRTAVQSWGGVSAAWWPQQRSRLMPSRTHSSNLHVM